MFTLNAGAVLLVVASLSLVGPPVECGGLSSLMGKLSKEWQWIDNFLKDDLSRDRINKYFAESQAQLEEPKLRDAFKLLVDAINVKPQETGCSESESLKVAKLFDSMNLELNANYDHKAKGVRKLALESRHSYGDFCIKKYFERLDQSLGEKLDAKVRSSVESFGAQYANARHISYDDMFDPTAEMKFTSVLTAGLMGRAICGGFRDWMSGYSKQLDTKTGKNEYNWAELVEDMRAGCAAYDGQVHYLLEPIARDAVVSRSLARLEFNWKIWKAWAGTLACGQLKNFDTEKLAPKLAIAFAKAEKLKRAQEERKALYIL